MADRFGNRYGSGRLPTNVGVSSETASGGVGIEVNRVLRNTYMLLGLTIAFSAAVAMVAYSMGYPGFFGLPMLLVFFGLVYLVHKTADTAWGLLTVFLFTGFLGANLGPIIGYYLQSANGPFLVASSLVTTAMSFLGLSAYAVITKKDFSFLSGFLMMGFFVLMGAVVLSLIFDFSAFSVAISCGFVLFAGAAILWQTGEIVNGGETNYIRATVTLYVQIYNLFLSLLHIFGALGDD